MAPAVKSRWPRSISPPRPTSSSSSRWHPWRPGNYVVWLAGDSSTDQAVLADPNGVPLGEDAAHPAGADESFSFQVDGIDGVAGATGSDDTASTARNLGDVTGAGLIQVSGAIGDDPSFNPSLSPDPTNPEPQFIPANQVDLYHFQITGPGRYAMLAEVFAGRIGSPLDPGISLYELDPSDGSLVFLAGNNNTLNPTQGTDGSIPLFTDSALTVGLTAGRLLPRRGRRFQHALAARRPDARQPRPLRSQSARQCPARLEHRPVRPEPPRPAGPDPPAGRGLVAVERPGP